MQVLISQPILANGLPMVIIMDDEPESHVTEMDE